MVTPEPLFIDSKDPRPEPEIMSAWRQALALDGSEREIPPWVLSWPALGNLKLGWAEADIEDYRGPCDLKRCFETVRKYPHVRFFDNAARSINSGFEAFRETLVDHCIRFNRRILAHYGFSSPELEKDFETYAHYTVEDYIFQNVAPIPARQSIARVLDIGAGFGRQLAAWSQHKGLEAYFAMDAIPIFYCAQHDYFAASGLSVQEYVTGRHEFDARGDLSNGGALIHHLPVWRHDLLPDSHFDLVIAVMVLPELDPRMIRLLLELFQRTLKPGGALYIRDWDNSVTHNRMPLNELIKTYGFVLEYRPHIIGGKDIHGIPRLWRKRDDDATLSMA